MIRYEPIAKRKPSQGEGKASQSIAKPAKQGEGENKAKAKPASPQPVEALERPTSAAVDAPNKKATSLTGESNGRPVESNRPKSNKPFDRVAYQREYMRKRRAAKRNPPTLA